MSKKPDPATIGKPKDDKPSAKAKRGIDDDSDNAENSDDVNSKYILTLDNHDIHSLSEKFCSLEYFLAIMYQTNTPADLRRFIFKANKDSPGLLCVFAFGIGAFAARGNKLFTKPDIFKDKSVDPEKAQEVSNVVRAILLGDKSGKEAFRLTQAFSDVCAYFCYKNGKAIPFPAVFTEIAYAAPHMVYAQIVNNPEDTDAVLKKYLETYLPLQVNGNADLKAAIQEWPMPQMWPFALAPNSIGAGQEPIAATAAWNNIKNLEAAADGKAKSKADEVKAILEGRKTAGNRDGYAMYL